MYIQVIIILHVLCVGAWNLICWYLLKYQLFKPSSSKKRNMRLLPLYNISWSIFMLCGLDHEGSIIAYEPGQQTLRRIGYTWKFCLPVFYKVGLNIVFHALTWFVESWGRCWKPEPIWGGFQLLLSDSANINAWKTMFDGYYHIKSLFCNIKQQNQRKCNCCIHLFNGWKSMEKWHGALCFERAAAREER